LFQFWNGGIRNLYVTVDNSGRLWFYNGDAGALTNVVIPTQQWVYLEVKITFHATAGTLEIRLDGSDTPVVDLTSLDTVAAGGSTVITEFTLGATADDVFYDDLYLLNTTGTINNDFLGDVQVVTLRPTADSAVAWTPSAGIDNYALVDEEFTDGDTTYVSTATTTNKDLYDFGNLDPAIDTVFGVAVHARVRKEEPGPRDLTLETKHSTDEQSSAGKGMGITERTLWELFETKDGTNAWTTTEVDAAQFGVELI
jgi:hypothetical protein